MILNQREFDNIYSNGLKYNHHYLYSLVQEDKKLSKECPNQTSGCIFEGVS